MRIKKITSTALLCLYFLSGCGGEYRLDMDIQGHRGCRGWMPENTLEGFLRALDMGVNTLEMDVVITGDRQVLVSHEAWFSASYCLDPEGNPISPADERKHNIYQMSFAETQAYDCGSKVMEAFPDQKKMVVHKPLLKEVIRQADAYPREEGNALPQYNIELKREPEAAGVFQPSLPEFVQLVLQVLEETDAVSRTTLQAFEVETLLEIRKVNQEVRLSLLVDREEDYLAKLSELGFYPAILSPDASLVDEDMMRFAADRNLKVIPWTVNELEEMHRLIDLGVAGIISDYPDRLVRVAEGQD